MKKKTRTSKINNCWITLIDKINKITISQKKDMPFKEQKAAKIGKGLIYENVQGIFSFFKFDNKYLCFCR